MKVKIHTNEFDVMKDEYRTFDAEIHKSIEECLEDTIVSHPGEDCTDTYLKIGNVIIPRIRLVAIEVVSA